MSCYVNVITNYDKALNNIKKLTQENTKFNEFIKATEKSAGTKNLQSLLIAPMQRITRYGILLAELLKQTDEDNPDFAKLSEAIQAIRKVTTYLNEKKREKDMQKRALELEDKLVGKPSKVIRLHFFSDS